MNYTPSGGISGTEVSQVGLGHELDGDGKVVGFPV
jgi:hypothetical protein